MIYNKITMSLKIYNTLTGKKENFKPIEKNKLIFLFAAPRFTILRISATPEPISLLI
jgi:hypothetical protein